MSIIEQFKNYRLNIKGQSENTINGFLSDLNLFFNYINLDMNNLTINQLQNIDEIQLEEFIVYCKNERNNSASACNRKICSLKAFFEFCYDKKEYIKKDPSKKLEKSKLPSRKPIYLTQEETDKLIDSINTNERHGLRDKCIVSIFTKCGLRISELVNLKITDINRDEITVIGKGDKQRTVVMNKTCMDIYKEYLEKRLLSDIESEYLFLSQKGNRISKRTVEDIISKITIKSGIDKNITPHKLRHTCATNLKKNGVDILTIQKILGHESVSTTQIYAHVDMDDVREAVRKIG